MTIRKNNRQLWRGFFKLLAITVFGSSFIVPALCSESKLVVSHVLNGETLELSNKQIVRLIGVNAFSLEKEEQNTENFGKLGIRVERYDSYAQKEKEFVAWLVDGEEVELQLDEVNTGNKHKDELGRTLAYVYSYDPDVLLKTVEAQIPKNVSGTDEEKVLLDQYRDLLINYIRHGRDEFHDSRKALNVRIAQVRLALSKVRGEDHVSMIWEDIITDMSRQEKGSFKSQLKPLQLNGMIIEFGYGVVDRRADFSRKADFIELEGVAKENKRGIWGEEKEPISSGS